MTQHSASDSVVLARYARADVALIQRLKQLDWSITEPAALPVDAQDWLTETGSLTARLKTLHPAFSVVVLDEAYEDGDWVRQVHLCLAGLCCVWALTRIPPLTLQHYPELRHQGRQPLGEWLFGAGQAQRSACGWRDLAALPGIPAILNAWNIPLNGALWGRQSRFQLPLGYMDVMEVFLPDLFSMTGRQTTEECL